MAGFEPVIGLEVHTELNSESKVFCDDPNIFGAEPNTQVSPISLGLPGTLPVLNKVSFEKALRTAVALHCDITRRTSFDRKHYYYPDLPKNYQISQDYDPLGRNGFVDLHLKDGQQKKIRINNIHLEEDAGKLVHPTDPASRGLSWVDLNRAGMPLLEIVTEPDIRNLEEMEVFMQTLRGILRYLDVSDCKMQEGSLRFEVNLSMRPKGSDEFGTKVEVKNVGSIKAALRAAKYEIIRQTEILESGGEVVQQTCLWDDDKGETRPMRSKEVAKDYRYFPDPDLPPVAISEGWLNSVQNDLPELQDAKRIRFIDQYGLPEYDAGVLVSDRTIADYFETCCGLHSAPKTFSNWIMVEVLRELQNREIEIDECPLTPKRLVELVKLVEGGTISNNIAKEVLLDVMETGKSPSEVVEEKGLKQESDEGALLAIIQEVIEENPGPAEEFRSGKEKAIGFLMGQVMKKTQGKANPGVCKPLLEKQLRS
ncbi:MAG: Asp-tRNA(Asn)/Glu-tRNA(Gln) amidotransferase subunit GatB [Candidatus Omnitrophica bacterium]|nr:Asp-tRNA(Asn)/Glu-tRNA(Gln) amidotransferase subunit GatB [Candidatus Omnitrophota bacterium]MCA9424016.1 Asp-tRNA(Asn)/Glu-tRNA(Gln) amidotransferase subunit GatB [Candidatus Omnitrophota bacterium]MCA9434472.1 Asp-tRNA(Asn)/Glu-tRNA(Gln) amidotransferase subunit GatB [Candidatus Omnitrophota bacterium]MCA9440103.1 Asp-tRNA(Asn)/Glu-tRNA(Gln) amidotransferase subunit GatB [Candidatus Omnitrophota bacterium]MCB9767995.1 Asp-tRNA(Asn)/Glu-tRNA(Gln) amidotransferase subunit GatB [Candidatus Om